MKKITIYSASFALLGLVFAALPAKAEYTLSASKVFGETALGTKNHSITVGKTVTLSLPNTTSTYWWFIADNTNPRVLKVELDQNGAVFTGLAEGVSSVRLCSFWTTKCINASMNVVKENVETGNVLGAATFINGQLVLQNKTVYMVYKNTKAPISDLKTLKGLGFALSKVTQSDVSGLTEVGYQITTAKAPHPWGTWIKQGKKIYFIHELGLIPVPSYEVFTGNGGADRLLVPANKYDFELSVLSPMVSSDERLK